MKLNFVYLCPRRIVNGISFTIQLPLMERKSIEGRLYKGGLKMKTDRHHPAVIRGTVDGQTTQHVFNWGTRG